jgi:UDP-glucuronate 4-epimerase
MDFLITGAAGFIGFHLSKRLLQEGASVVGIDNLNPYYDVSLKKGRLEQLETDSSFEFVKVDLEDRAGMEEVFRRFSFTTVVHFAAQAGVRYSLVNPYGYVNSNLLGLVHMLECCKEKKIEHLVFASSSSVYGANTRMPLSVHHGADHPISLYAATKRAGELIIHSYAALYAIPSTCLRFFTVYGPWGRPDMAYFKFTKNIVEGEPIEVYNYGKMKRDFTYIDDIIEGVFRILARKPKHDTDWESDNPDPSASFAPYKIYNIGNSDPVDLLEFISILEEELGKRVEKKLLPLQAGDIVATYANIADLESAVGFRPKTTMRDGIKAFVHWYREYYKIT